ncbi:hypothetical protein CYY_001706 [Polysphondylium violaceum]|uniref:Uncharacterized protein n=1 Tax=Polysphondylium violaceum TaxID=133409 RepID=A0A8J4V7N2_9MYCE|nr:hypothetical protein CYY_001706 [Polysphondylium violaceum]
MSDTYSKNINNYNSNNDYNNNNYNNNNNNNYNNNDTSDYEDHQYQTNQSDSEYNPYQQAEILEEVYDISDDDVDQIAKLGLITRTGEDDKENIDWLIDLAQIHINQYPSPNQDLAEQEKKILESFETINKEYSHEHTKGKYSKLVKELYKSANRKFRNPYPLLKLYKSFREIRKEYEAYTLNQYYIKKYRKLPHLFNLEYNKQVGAKVNEQSAVEKAERKKKRKKLEDQEKIVTMPVGTPIPLILQKKGSTNASTEPQPTTTSTTSATAVASTDFSLDSKLLDALIPIDSLSQKNIAGFASKIIDDNSNNQNQPQQSQQNTTSGTPQKPQDQQILSDLIKLSQDPLVLDQVKQLLDQQRFKEAQLLSQREELLHNQLERKKFHLQKFCDQLLECGNDNNLKKEIQRKLSLEAKMVHDHSQEELRQFSLKIVNEMNNILTFQQLSLQRLGIVGFFPTNNSVHLEQQMKILECLFPTLIETLKRPSPFRT